ncbi:MAG TPA: Rne/Rng family ribonuclease, partial [Stellaceae bacterium]|nr:Rne/Rng family ribonuclease [Stellaceae bacterium]
MAKRMLIDATHPEETRVVVLSGNRLEEFDFESSTKKQVKGNIYLAKVTRVEPSLQAAFVDYGGNRHGFLAFSEIHPDYYRIPVGDREAMDGDTAGDEAEVRETAQEEAGVALAVTLPEPVPVPTTPEGGEDEATETGSSDQHGSASDETAPISSLQDWKLRGEPAVTGLPWEDLAPVRGAPAPEPVPKPAVAVPESVAHMAVRVESTLVGFDESIASGEVAPGSSWDYPADTDESPVETLAAVDLRADGDREGGESETIETIDGDELEEAERQRSRTFRLYKIQEVVKRRQIMLVQVSKEERGNKGAALTTYLSLAGRYCVLMPNTARGGGVSRKITSITDRRRLKDVLEELDIPDGMGVIVRTAGAERSKAEIKRDYEYLLRLWNEIRDLTLRSTAPAMIYEEGHLIKRSIRDLYTRDIDEVLVEGEDGYRTAKAFMKMLMPSHARRVQPYRDPQIGLLHRFQVESQIDAIHSPIVQLRSGGYVVINQTEALVAIDVNSGRSTRERNIEETAVRTNLEAAEEIARQLRLRDLAGLIVIDFIDMEEHRNQIAVERRLKEALKNDRARIQVGRISPFGLLEMSRQRLRPSLVETSTQPCPHCGGTGFIRSTESTALYVLRSIEEEGMRRRAAEICVYVPTTVALYILNQKRDSLVQLETRYGLRVLVARDDALIPPAFRLERLRAYGPAEAAVSPAAPLTQAPDIKEEEEEAEIEDEVEEVPEPLEPEQREQEGEEERARSRRRRRRRRRRDDEPVSTGAAGSEVVEAVDEVVEAVDEVVAKEGRAGSENGNGDEQSDAERRRRRRGRRGGRRRARGESGFESPFEEPRPPSELVEILPTSDIEEPETAPVAALASMPVELRHTRIEAASESVPSGPKPVEAPEVTQEEIVRSSMPHL